MEFSRALIFVNGEINQPEKLLSLINPEDYIVAVDGGLRHILTMNLKPDLLIGDLDSVKPEHLKWVQEREIEVVTLPVHKDETDLEAALVHVIELGIKNIVLLAAIGDRIDHTLANIFVLTKPALSKYSVQIWDGNQELIVINRDVEIFGKKGDLVSLLPLNGKVVGVTTEELEYPLNQEDLYSWNARGISNKMTSDHARVFVEAGYLLCIHQTENFGQEKEN